MCPVGTSWILPVDKFWKRQAWSAIRYARHKGFSVGMIVLASLGKMRDQLAEDDVVFYMWPLSSGDGAAAIVGRK